MNFYAFGILLLIAVASLPTVEVKKVTKKCTEEIQKCASLGYVVQKNGLTEEEQAAILDLHNEIRSSVAKGTEEGLDGTLLPSASNMNKLTWSEELAKLVQDNFNSCNLETPKLADDIWMLRVPDVEFIWEKGTQTVDTTKNIIQGWRSGANHFSESMVDTGLTRGSPLPLWNFKLLITAEVNEIGCGHINLRHFLGKQYEEFTCLYRPSTGGLGARVYQKGRTGSDCTKSDDDGLCTA